MLKIKYAVLLITLLGCLWLFGCGCIGGTEQNGPPFEDIITPVNVDILKVGKADCIVINTGTKIVMIDTAEEENLPQIHSYMQKNGYNRVDLLILTHFDKDHIGGAAQIISKYGVASVIESGFTSPSQWYLSYHDVLDTLDIEPLKLKENYSFLFDSCQFNIDVPKRDKYATKQDNNASLVVSMKIGENSFLFCGDAMELRIEELIEDSIGHYDFVKLPYHGNYLQNYSALLNIISPSYGALTCSNKNPPSEETLSILEKYNVAVYQTRYGEVNVSSDGKKITIEQ